MSGWEQHLDDLAGATARLLALGLVRNEPLVDPRAAMAARDAVVSELRSLIGAIADVPLHAVVRDLTVFDVGQRPAQALHQALSELPRAVEFGMGGQLDDPGDRTVPEYERLWQVARRAMVALEGYVGPVSRVPATHGWTIVRDLADVAAALPYLDQDLSEAIRPLLVAGEDLAVPYEMLTHERHDAVRIITSEIRSRVPASEPRRRPAPASRPTPAPAEPRQRSLGSNIEALADVAARRPGASGPPPAGGPPGAADLAEAMTRFTYAVSARSSDLSVPELKTASRLLEYGSGYAAAVLDRAAPAVAAGAQAAQQLRAVGPAANRVRAAPAQSIGSPQLGVVRAGVELLARMKALAEHAGRLPGDASAQDLRRLAGPAVQFAQHVPALAGALNLSVRQAVAHGLMLVPGIADPTSTVSLSWVTARMGAPGRDGPPQVITAAGQLSVTARQLAPAVREVGVELSRAVAVQADPGQHALLTARRHAGAARSELRSALNDRIASQAAPLSAPWPRHPRAAAPPRVPGLRR